MGCRNGQCVVVSDSALLPPMSPKDPLVIATAGDFDLGGVSDCRADLDNIMIQLPPANGAPAEPYSLSASIAAGSERAT